MTANVRLGSWLCKNAATSKLRRKEFLHMAAPIKSGQVALEAAVRNEADLLAILEPPTAATRSRELVVEPA